MMVEEEAANPWFYDDKWRIKRRDAGIGHLNRLRGWVLSKTSFADTFMAVKNPAVIDQRDARSAMPYDTEWRARLAWYTRAQLDRIRGYWHG